MLSRTITMEERLIEFIKDNISLEDCQYTYSKMCVERIPLRYANNQLYNKLGDLVDDFVADNELPLEWFDQSFINLEELFERLLDC